MKTKEELNALKNEIKALNSKLAELNEEEFIQVTGGGSQSSWGTGWGVTLAKKEGNHWDPDWGE